jgi:hypothetical protein
MAYRQAAFRLSVAKNVWNLTAANTNVKRITQRLGRSKVW